MTSEQLAHNAVCDSEWTDQFRVSSYEDIEESWSDSIPLFFSTYTPPVQDTRTTKDLHTIELGWPDIDFKKALESFQKWSIIDSTASATSPYLHLVRDPDLSSSFDSLLTFLGYASGREDGERLAERLVELRLDLAEDTDSPNISMPSVLGLVHFLRGNPQLHDPNLVANNAGNIRAEWHKSWAQHFVIEFTSDVDARFVLFYPHPRTPQKTTRMSATNCSIDSLIEQVPQDAINIWVIRE